MRADESLVTVYLSVEEIDVMAVALARSVLPDSKASNAVEASRDVWSVKESAGPVLCSLATMLAEARA